MPLARKTLELLVVEVAHRDVFQLERCRRRRRKRFGKWVVTTQAANEPSFNAVVGQDFPGQFVQLVGAANSGELVPAARLNLVDRATTTSFEQTSGGLLRAHSGWIHHARQTVDLHRRCIAATRCQPRPEFTDLSDGIGDQLLSDQANIVCG